MQLGESFNPEVEVAEAHGLGRGQGFKNTYTQTSLESIGLGETVAKWGLDAVKWGGDVGLLPRQELLKQLNINEGDGGQAQRLISEDLSQQIVTLTGQLSTKDGIIEELTEKIVKLRKQATRRDRIAEETGEEAVRLKKQNVTLKKQLDHRTEQAKKLLRFVKQYQHLTTKYRHELKIKDVLLSDFAELSIRENEP